MSATRDARTAKRKLAELGITSATVLTGSTTITIDLAAFDVLLANSFQRTAARTPSEAEMARMQTEIRPHWSPPTQL